ncbi:MAG: reductive dehalogenase [Candidatus Heimdallarchaeaceae archaeon]
MLVQVSKELCNPSKCNQECISVCPQNLKKKVAINIVHDKAGIIQKNCIQCMKCVEVCPLKAIEIKENRKKGRKTKKELDLKDETITYPFEIDENYKQFSERMNIFARVMWDESFEGYKKPIFANGLKKAKQGIDGYSEIEVAAIQAAWSIENLISMMEKSTVRKKLLPKELQEKEEAEAGTIKSTRGSEVDGHPELRKYEVKDKKEMTIWLKKIAKFYGADLIGIAPFDIKWIYSEDRKGIPYEIPENIKYAIVIAVEMDINAINTAPKMPSAIATGLGYSKMAFVRTLLSSFIRNLGYEAIPAGNDLGLSVPLAVMAGLGGYGRHGLLITKKFGPRVRIAKILTDLPLVPDKPNYKFIKAVERFCKTCKTCAERCPSGSIPMDDEPSYKTYSVSNNPGIKKWYVNVETCYLYWTENGCDCSRCIADCEYNHVFTLPHRIVNWLVENVPILNPIWPIVGKILGYGGNKSAKKFWKKIKIN